MARSCFNHIQAPAVFTCAQCGMPLCANCVSMIGQVPACLTCAPALRARVSQPAAVSAAAPGGTGQAPGQSPQPYGAGQSPYYGAAAADPSAAAIARANQEHGRNLLLGLLAGLVIGIIGSIIVLKILFYSGYGISYLYIGVGYGIGYGIWKFTGRGGPGLAIGAVTIMVISLLIAHIVYANDVLNEVRAAGHAEPGTTVLDAIPVAMGAFSPMHWVCIVIGLGACWRGVAQQSQ